ncbi:L-histidine N(alpha)-methyltransferase [Tundrisphaera lichenicola]|uniref:L-histidine N(alpha)-methyltransferase n=1 Tax=Tundrisphaera lichenicola TaxID=2029860 RepID=UPI003EBF0005
MTSVRTRRLTIIEAGDSSGEAPDAFAVAVRAGLQSDTKTLPCRYFYDDEGSRLFEQICDLPEYYPTRTEDAILRDHADAMVEGWAADPVMVELGSGSSSKTRRLIAAAIRAYGRLHYVPIDVSKSILEESAVALVGQFPKLRVTGYAASYQEALEGVVERFDRPKLYAFLGSSLGNYEVDEAVGLLATLARDMDSSDRLLLGTDLDKDPAVLRAAYDDAQGVTARFNLNLLTRINRELGGRFDPGQFRHEARYNADLRRVEMHLVSLVEQDVFIPGAGLTAQFAPGESIHTENSHKYTPEILRTLADRAGFEEEAAWTDEGQRFRVQRWRPRRSAG